MSWLKMFETKEEAHTKVKQGKPQLLLIGNTRICLVLFEEMLYAIEDKCSHNGESLSKGTVNYWGEVICPWHGYRFKLATGREAGERSRDVKTYPVKENEQGVYILMG